MNTVVVSHSLTKDQKLTALIIFAIFGALMFWLFYTPPISELAQVKEVEPPEEIIFALANVEGNVGSPMDQYGDIYKISEALRVGVATSKSLGKDGKNYWLKELRGRVAVREAVEALEELKHLETKSLFEKLSRQELGKVERLKKTIEAQIYSQYAKDEGLRFNHGQLGNLVDQITKR